MNHVKCGSSGKCWIKFYHRFSRVTLPGTKGTCELINMVRLAGSLLVDIKMSEMLCAYRRGSELNGGSARTESLPQHSRSDMYL
jgi:hypothetical protein